ncbi:MAG: Isoleucyl-tRNA synthetase, partial [Candidatus Dadabacteria bacterium]|nr:Isoleucyl-tRNA synthetase [Candidatus Dadabacteria bacterium]
VRDALGYEKLEEIDKWILHRLGILSSKILKGYVDYEFHIVYYELQRFCIVDLSAIYLDIQKDVLYTFPPNSEKRRSAQTAIHIILDYLTKLSAPVLSFTADEVWQYIPGEKLESVHLTSFPKTEFINDELEEKWTRLLLIRDEILKALERARKDKFIGSSLEAGLKIYAEGEIKSFIEEELELITALAIVSHIEVFGAALFESQSADTNKEILIRRAIPGLNVDVLKASGEKCERCWTYRTSVGINPDYPTLCDRCIGHLRERKA